MSNVAPEGIEPSYQACRACILPLNYRANKDHYPLLKSCIKSSDIMWPQLVLKTIQACKMPKIIP